MTKYAQRLTKLLKLALDRFSPYPHQIFVEMAVFMFAYGLCRMPFHYVTRETQKGDIAVDRRCELSQGPIFTHPDRGSLHPDAQMGYIYGARGDLDMAHTVPTQEMKYGNIGSINLVRRTCIQLSHSSKSKSPFIEFIPISKSDSRRIWSFRWVYGFINDAIPGSKMRADY